MANAESDALTRRGFLEAAGAAHHVVRQNRGGYLVCPQGARVLGACPGPDDDNVFWTADCCNTAQALKAAIDSGEWNFGGDRLWLSPELKARWEAIVIARGLSSNRGSCRRSRNWTVPCNRRPGTPARRRGVCSWHGG